MDVKISLPLLPLRDIVVFPSMVIPLFVGRDKSISALNEVMKKDKKIILVTQKNSEIDDPSKTDPSTGYCYGCGRSNEEKQLWKKEDTSDDWKKK